MAKLTKDEFISSLKEMNLLEIKELLDAMKEEFGVDQSALPIKKKKTEHTKKQGQQKKERIEQSKEKKN